MCGYPSWAKLIDVVLQMWEVNVIQCHLTLQDGCSRVYPKAALDIIQDLPSLHNNKLSGKLYNYLPCVTIKMLFTHWEALCPICQTIFVCLCMVKSCSTSCPVCLMLMVCWWNVTPGTEIYTSLHDVNLADFSPRTLTSKKWNSQSMPMTPWERFPWKKNSAAKCVAQRGQLKQTKKTK